MEITTLSLNIFVFLFVIFFFITSVFTFLIWKGFFYKKREWKLFNSWRMYFVHYLLFYFDTGRGRLNLIEKVLFLVTGSAAVLKLEYASPKYILIWGSLYAVLCWITGFIWVNLSLLECEQEVKNLNDAFVKEMREKFKDLHQLDI